LTFDGGCEHGFGRAGGFDRGEQRPQSFGGSWTPMNT